MTDKSIGIVKTEILRPELENGFRLDKGGILSELEVAYETYGILSENKDNVILICHALSGDAHAAGRHTEDDSRLGWWDTMLGPGKGIDTDAFFVICSNVLGGCKGTTGPSSVSPETGKPYGSDFPEITIADMVRVQKLLLESLGIEKLFGVIGGSAGGLQVLEWCLLYPDTVKNAVCIAAAECLSAQALSFDIIARKIIMADPYWNNGHYYESSAPEKGLSLARMIGHITYLSKESMDSKFGRERREGMELGQFNTDFQVESYLDHQGTSFADRFDANSFLYITGAMNSYCISERGKSLEDVFRKVRSRFLLISVSSDWLYPAEQSRKLAESLMRAGKKVTYCSLTSPYGHDSFLLENQGLSDMIDSFFGKPGSGPLPPVITGPEIQKDYEIISRMIAPDSTIIDLGCGDGSFLAWMKKNGFNGTGVDFDFDNIIKCNRKHVAAVQENLDEGLGMIPDDFFDCAVLSRTLLEVHKPHLVLKEMTRVARTGILSFPNFASLKHRLRLGFKGRLPLGGALPYQWYDTPNIHFLTLKDFKVFCDKNDLDILNIQCIPEGGLSRLFVRMKWCNIGADRVVVKIAKKGTVPGETPDCKVCSG